MPNVEKKGIRARFQGLSRLVKVACWFGLLAIAYTLLGFLVAPLLAKKILENKLPALLHRPVSIGKIALNPYSLTVVIDNFQLAQKEGAGDLVAFDRLLVNLGSASIFKRALIIEAISLSEPRIEFSRLNAQTYSFSDLLTGDPEKKTPPPEQSRPFQFAIRNIEIKGGRIIFHDLPKKTDHSVTALNLGIPALSNLPYQVETYVQPSFSATINGTPFALGGQSKPFAKSLETVVELKASGINVPEYLAYIPNPTGLVLQSALLDVDARLHLLARPDNTYRLAVIGRVALRELAIADKAGKAYLQIPELALTLADSDLLAKEVHLNEIKLTAPVVNLERLSDGSLQPVALLNPAAPEPGKNGPAATPATAGKPDPTAATSLKIDIDKVLLSDGRVAFLDDAVGATLSTQLDIDTSLSFLAKPETPSRLAVIGQVNLRNLAVADKAGKSYLKLPELALTLADANLLTPELHFSAINLTSPTVNLERLADGSLLPVALLIPADKPQAGGAGTKATSGNSGKSGPGEGSSLKVDIDKMVLSDGLVDYLDAAAGAKVSTRVEIDTALHLEPGQNDTARLAVLGLVKLRALALADKLGKVYLKLPELALTFADANLLANELHFSEINLQSPTVNLERLADGRLLPVALLIPAEKAPAEAATPPPAAEAGKGASPPLKLAIDKLVLNNGRVDFLDVAVGAEQESAQLSLSELAIQVAKLSNAPEALANLTLSGKLNQGANLKVKGRLGLEPVQANLNLQLTNLALQPFQAYISEQARIVVADGKLTVVGDLALRSKTGGGLKSDFQGEASVANLATVDAILGEDLVNWRELGLKKIHFASDPGQLSVAAINLLDPYLNVLFGQDGVINLTTIRPEKAAAKPPSQEKGAPTPAAEQAPPFATNIGSIGISGGRLDFTDRQVTPTYATTLSELRGSISDLSSLAASSAAVDFAAKLDQQAPLKITGRLNPLSSDLLVDLKVDFGDINLSPMSPYSGKYIGYKIDKGKLNLDLKYDIVGRKLDSQNRAFIDQFTLGESVDSPDATNLPVRLAVSLLKDRKGVITFDVPVSGSLDNPDFSVGRIVIKVLLNLIAKAATSPAALLGALIPAGQDIQFIPFIAGSAAISPEAATKLLTVENVLYERPGLKMDLLGKIEPVADTAALARLHMTTSVKLQKLLAGGKVGKDAAAQVEGVELSGEEYPIYLNLAYQAARKSAKEPKPAKGTPPADIPAMEAYLMGGIKVGADELRLLALARANHVLTTLGAGGKVEPGRLFVVEPKIGAAGEPAAATQVELVIK